MDRPRAVVAIAAAAATACSLAFPTREASDAGATTTDASSSGAPPDGSSGGAGARSCAGLARTCGAGHDRDCCEAADVPGGTFARSYDGLGYTSQAAPATVSAFRLDVFEATVGRFRAFVAAYARPALGSGRDPANGGDAGWRSELDAALPADGASLARLVGGCDGSTWTDAAGAADDRAIDCVTWYEAFAFCVWDGGRLPTEAEWNFAAAGGDEQRPYPWSAPKTAAIDASRAVYMQTAVFAVGSKPAGDGRWRHADLAGNVAEWVVDTKGDYASSCLDCANLTFPFSEKVFRGGAFDGGEAELLVARRDSKDPANRLRGVGVRCAR